MTNAAVVGEWKPMASAPKDGTLVLVAIRESEQGPAQVDVARWTKPARANEKCVRGLIPFFGKEFCVDTGDLLYRPIS